MPTSKPATTHFLLFEIGKGHIKMHGLDEDGLPEASQFTDIVYAAKKPGTGTPFYVIRRLVEQLVHDLGAKLRLSRLNKNLRFRSRHRLTNHAVHWSRQPMERSLA
ncbi:hypothetical protein KOY48_03785 [Candidatus Minimicrobia naudis]|uniref:Uncharacterized protein n=1 Tax=Candidatus Minimicrobia naudis TaxID=2841263 RepID=A0A8F1MCX1_9BACT|nr:hypothetical protein KOY48_03785 [Candidatus Minimicrobia naudis]